MDKRFYRRLSLDIEGVFILDKEDAPGEFKGIIEDLSESGIKIIIDTNAYPNAYDAINENDLLYFTAADEFKLFDEDQSFIIQGKAKIIRKRVTKDALVIGGEIVSVSNEIMEYLLSRRTSIYMDSLNNKKGQR